MKIKIIFTVLLLSSCSSNTGYIIDPRGSKEPREIIRDKLECRELVKPLEKHKNERILGIIPFCTSAQCMKYGSTDYDPFKKCLTNRGHSVLN